MPALLVVVSVKIGIIDFPQGIIKKKVARNCLSSPLLPSPMMMFGVCFGPGPFTLSAEVETMIRRSYLEVDVSRRRAVGMQEKPGWRNVPGKFLRTKSTNESFLALDIQSSNSL